LIDYYEPDIVTANDYYPFGMLSRVAVPNDGSTYRFGFNGKMMDNDVKGLGNQQDYGMRIYDPRVGRFLSTDPLTKDYAWYTPYQFAGNTPIQALDLDGKEEYHYTLTIDKQGSTHLSKPVVRYYQEHSILGIHFRTQITPERYIVTFQNKKYYIGFAGTMKGWGNEWGRKLFQAWMGNGDHPGSASMFTNLFYNENDSKEGKRIEQIESMREYFVTGVRDHIVQQLGVGLPILKYKLRTNDLDWRGQNKSLNEALDEAFKKTGVDRKEFKVTRWGKDQYGKSIPVEYRAKGGAEVSVDFAHNNEGQSPDAPHVGWQTPGKNNQVGHIILDDVPAGRSNDKLDKSQH
jgi:RHS repeat-associated protein